MNPADITPPAIQCVYKLFPVYQEVHQANANANANTACYNRPAVNPPSMMVLMFRFCWNCFRDALIRLVWSFLGESTLFRGVCSIFTNERRRDNSNMIVRNNHKVESDPAVWPSGRDDLLQDSCINLSVPNKLTHTFIHREVEKLFLVVLSGTHTSALRHLQSSLPNAVDML